MPRLTPHRNVRQLDRLPPGLDVTAALADADGAPGVALLVEGAPALVLMLSEAILFRDWLTEAIADAGKLAVQYGERVRKASKARGN